MNYLIVRNYQNQARIHTKSLYTTSYSVIRISILSLVMTPFHIVMVASESGTNELHLDRPNITCSQNFYLKNSTCVPICQEWKQYSDVEYALVIYSIAISGIVSLLGCIAVVIGSIIRYKSM